MPKTRIVKYGPNDPRAKGADKARKYYPGVTNPHAFVVPEDEASSRGPIMRTYSEEEGWQGYEGLQQDASLGFIPDRRDYDVRAGRAQATTRGVTEEERAQYQLDQMLGSDSPLMRRAGASGMAMAGKRGLMNSSLAAGAAQGAMMDRAEPYVLSDADAYRRAASESMEARNAASMTNAQLITQANISEAELEGAWDRAAMQAKAQAAMAELQRRWQSGESEAQRGWQSSENLLQREWQTGEREAGQDWQTGEREAGQNWQSGENILNRDWTSAENRQQRMLQWTTAQLQSYASMRMSENSAMAQVMANIYAHPDLTAEEQRAAWANAQVSFRELYGRDFVPPEGFPNYDEFTPDSTFLDPTPPPAESSPHPFDQIGQPATGGGGGSGAGAGGGTNPNKTPAQSKHDDPLMDVYDPGATAQASHRGGKSWPSKTSPNAQAVQDALPDV